jgi:hypothetical protein
MNGVKMSNAEQKARESKRAEEDPSKIRWQSKGSLISLFWTFSLFQLS